MSSLPPSPPGEDFLTYNPLAVETAARMLQAQGEAIVASSNEFTLGNRHNGPAQLFCHSLSLIQAAVTCGGKVIISGMGKSYKIGSKLVATSHSFGIPSAALHPSEASHGDIGLVHAKDVLILISASGNSPELAALIRHLPNNVATVCLTCNENSPSAQASTAVIAAPVAAHHREQALYGLPAPSITTTLCLAIGDAMCVALHESLVEDEKRRHANFKRWHPGGAIGIANGVSDVATDELAITAWSSIPKLNGPLHTCEPAQIWRSVALSPYIIADEYIYKGSDVIAALETGILLSRVRGEHIQLASSTRGQGLCIFRDKNNQPTGMVWD